MPFGLVKNGKTRGRCTQGRPFVAVLLLGLFIVGFSVLAQEGKASSPANSEPDPDNWQVTLFQEDKVFTSGKDFYLENMFGDFRVRPADDEITVITAALQGEKNDAIKPVIHMVETDERVEIRVTFPNPEGGPDLTPEQTGKRRVDLALFLGNSGQVTIKSRHGLLEVKGLPGHLKVESESAYMRLVVKNTLDVFCGYGQVDVFFKNLADYHPPHVTTITGNIRVEFPEHVNAQIRAETAGVLGSDFSTQVKKTSGDRRKKATIQLGKKGEPVVLKSDSGNITVLERPSLVLAGTKN